MSRKEETKLALRYLAPYKFTLVSAFFSSLVSVAMLLAVPVLLGSALDLLLGQSYFFIDSLSLCMLLLVGAIVLEIVFQWLTSVLTARLTYGVTKHIRDDLYKQVTSLPTLTLEKMSAGDITSLITTDADLVADGILQGTQQLFSGLATIIGTLICMLLLSWPITIIVVVLTPLSIVITLFISKKTYATFQEERRLQAKLSATIQEMFANEALIRAFNQEARLEKQTRAINKRLYKAGERAQFSASLTNPGTRFVNNIVYALVALVGCLVALRSNAVLTIGVIQSFLLYASQYSKPFYEVTGVLTQLQAAKSALGRIGAFLDLQPLSHPRSEPREITKLPKQSEVCVEHVSFAYEAKEVLHDVSWKANAGQNIALVGPTGCGKSTMINLLCAFGTPSSGCIEIDGALLGELGVEDVRAHISLVLQDSWVFSGTVFENIAFAKPGATKQEVVDALTKTQALSFVEQLPKGLDTKIGEGGEQLSEGQLQLLSITRALLKGAPILVLDEATSAIDTRTELLVQRALREMMRGCTSITVAHRLSTIKESDLILVMQDGHIVERGTHDALMKKDGEFAKLARAQWHGLRI